MGCVAALSENEGCFGSTPIYRDVTTENVTEWPSLTIDTRPLAQGANAGFDSNRGSMGRIPITARYPVHW